MRMLTGVVLAALVCSASVALGDEDNSDARPLVTIDVLIAEIGNERGPGATDNGEKAGGEQPAPAKITAQSLLEKERQGKLSHSTRAHFVTLAGQDAMVQLGERVPVVSGRTLTARGGASGFRAEGQEQPAGPRFATSYTIEDIGTIISVNPQVEAGGSIVLNLRIEKSRLSETDGAAANSEDGRRPKTVSFRGQSTVRIPAGEPVFVEGFQSGTAGEASGQYVVVTATVEGRPTAKESAGEPKKDTGRVYVLPLRHADANEALQLLASIYGTEGLRTAADSRTNSIIVLGPEEKFSTVRALIEKLDSSAATTPVKEGVERQ